MENELKNILKNAHESCECNGSLSKITLKDLKKLNDKYTAECTYCPFNTKCKVCSAVADIVFHDLCYNCNKCKKWSIEEDEEKIINEYYEEEYGL